MLTSVTRSVSMHLSDTFTLGEIYLLDAMELIIPSSIKLCVLVSFSKIGNVRLLGSEPHGPRLALEGVQGKGRVALSSTLLPGLIVLCTIWLDNSQPVLSEIKKKNRFLSFEYLWPEFGHLWQTLVWS